MDNNNKDVSQAQCCASNRPQRPVPPCLGDGCNWCRNCLPIRPPFTPPPWRPGRPWEMQPGPGRPGRPQGPGPQRPPQGPPRPGRPNMWQQGVSSWDTDTSEQVLQEQRPAQEVLTWDPNGAAAASQTQSPMQGHQNSFMQRSNRMRWRKRPSQGQSCPQHDFSWQQGGSQQGMQGNSGTPVQNQGSAQHPAMGPMGSHIHHMQNSDLSEFPVGMGYVPMQQWSQTYPISQGFQRGTIFPELDLPFMMGRCAR